MAATANYSVSATGAGLNLSLFGNKLTGGNSTACANSGTPASGSTWTNKDANGNPTHCDGKAAPEAYAQGEGTLLTASGLHGLATAEATAAGQSVAVPTNAPNGYNCSQLSSGGPQGSNGVTLDLAASCAYALAAVDNGGNPSATAYGEVAHLNVDLAGILGQIAGGSPVSGSADTCNQATGTSQTVGQLLNGLCQVLTQVSSGGGSSAPAPIGGLFDGVAQALQNLYDVTSKDSPSQTVAIALGPAKSTIGSNPDGTITTKATGETLEVDALPGVGCTAGTSLATCATNEITYLGNETANPTAAPLITLKIAPASCTGTLDPGSTSWKWTSYSSIVDLDLNVPGDNIPVHIPGNAGSGQTIAAGTPLQSTIRVASGTPLGAAACAGDAVTVSLLENPQFPGGSTTPGGGAITAQLGSTTGAGTGATTAGVTSAGGTTTTTAAAGGPGAAPTGLVSTSPTSVHTGEWWAGSLPLLAVLAALGGGLLGWPRLRRVPMVARLVSRGSR